MTQKILATSALFCAATALGSGFQVLEQGAGNIGTAMAGSVANANGDASSAFWNPSASIFSGIEEGGLMMDQAMTFVIPSFEFNDKGSTNPMGNSGGNGGNAGEVAYVPNFYLVHRFLEDWAVTLSLTAPYGLETDYDNDWVGRFHGINSNMLTIDINPSIVYKVTDWLSISAGGSAQWIHAKLTQASMVAPGMEMLTSVTGSSWSGGANVGATIQYMEGGRLGFSWRSEVSQSVSGNLHGNGQILSPVSADITLPQTFNVGVYQRLWGQLDRFAVMADYSWTGWSSFDELQIRNRNTGSIISNTVENWKDVSRVALGFHYYPEFDENLTLRLGTAWDESPIRGAEYRTVRIPCTDRIWISAGLGYKYDDMFFNFGYTYILFYNDSSINTVGSPTSGSVKGEYAGHAHLVSIQAGISW